jgi:hypothetical protein
MDSATDIQLSKKALFGDNPHDSIDNIPNSIVNFKYSIDNSLNKNKKAE